jgi:hypothetical protein
MPSQRVSSVVPQIAATLLSASCSFAAPMPTIEWSRQQGTSASDGGKGVAIDSSGNVLITGYTQGDLAAPNSGNGDPFVSKYDADGTLLWTRQFGIGTGAGGWTVSANLFGDLFVAGPRVLKDPISNYHNWDIYLSKFDATGAQQWMHFFGTPLYDVPHMISADSTGNVYVVGDTGGNLSGKNAGDNDAFVSKYDGSGAHLWTRQFGNQLEQVGRGVSVDGSGSVFVAGSTDGHLSGASAGSIDVFIAKYDDIGNLQWSRQMGTPVFDFVSGVAADQRGNVFVSGYTRGDLGGSNSGSTDIFLAKYDSEGLMLWTRQWGTDRHEFDGEVTTDGFGNAFVVNSAISHDGAITGNGAGDVYVTKVDPAGNLLWTHQFGTEAFEGGRDIAADLAGNVYVIGETRGGSLGAINAGQDDAFLVKITEIPEPSGVVSLVVAMAILVVTLRKSTIRIRTDLA